jgi:glyoxylase-like metal-dependent hydrolase (beta-lactamase superfamily II)
MEVQKIGKRGIVFTFRELEGYITNIYGINGNWYFFLCDTFLGPNSMKEVTAHIADHGIEKPMIIFNSHHHWDHVWGNCAFPASSIIGHDLCREMMMQEGAATLKENAAYRQGNVRLVFPNVTFQERIVFPEEGIEFFHSPGHTEDSASCFDSNDHVLYGGDTIEDPIPFLFYKKLDIFRSTLERYLALDAHAFVPGHGAIGDRSLVEENLAYLDAFIADAAEKYTHEPYREIHERNRQVQNK